MITRLIHRLRAWALERNIRAVQDEIIWIERNCACTSDDYAGHGEIAQMHRKLRELESKRMGVDTGKV